MIACGYHLSDARIRQLNTYLDEKNATKIDIPAIIATLTHLKEIELANQQENEADEYLDAFVALGGEADKGGTV